MERRLTAILAADVVGYSRLMELDEAGTLSALKTHRKELIDPAITAHRGRIVKLMGDGTLVEFASVVDAVTCAVAIQTGMTERNSGTPEDRRIELRVGVHLGDIIVEGEDIYGEGVNIAARLESLAPPNGIYVSNMVFQGVDGKLGNRFEDLGERQVKNIGKPVHVYSITLEDKPRDSDIVRPRPNDSRRRWVIGVGIIAFIVAGGLLAWTMLEWSRSNSSAAGCTDHLGLPVPAEECPGNQE